MRPSHVRRCSAISPTRTPTCCRAAQVRCYGFEELFAEKLRALVQRCRPRDLYDVVHLFRRRDLRAEPELIGEVLAQKCLAKGIEPPTAQTILQSTHRAELASEWENMLGHQLPALPPLEQFWDEVPTVFGWLAGDVPPDELTALGGDDDQDSASAADHCDLGARRPPGNDPLRRGESTLHSAALQRQRAGHRAILAAAHPRRQSPSPCSSGRHRGTSLVPRRSH